MKKFLKVTFVGLAVAAFLPAFTLAGCTKIAGNYPHFYYTEAQVVEDGVKIGQYEISLTDKTYSDDNGQGADAENILAGGTAPRYTIDAPQGYEGVIPYIESYELNERSVLDTRGYTDGGKLYGFIDVYYKTIDYLSGGGNYGVEEICRGVVFEYAPETDTFTEKVSLDKSSVFTATTCFIGKRKIIIPTI